MRIPATNQISASTPSLGSDTHYELILPVSWSGLLAGIMMVIRTVFEDRLLISELPGYTDYARKVRYRLLPGIW